MQQLACAERGLLQTSSRSFRAVASTDAGFCPVIKLPSNIPKGASNLDSQTKGTAGLAPETRFLARVAKFVAGCQNHANRHWDVTVQKSSFQTAGLTIRMPKSPPLRQSNKCCRRMLQDTDFSPEYGPFPSFYRWPICFSNSGKTGPEGRRNSALRFRSCIMCALRKSIGTYPKAQVFCF